MAQHCGVGEFESQTVAVIFIGNAGAGKSTLLNQIGGNFGPGVKWRKGFTKEVSEVWIELDGERILLMDVPGLYEPDNEETNNNAEKLTNALKRGYDYKLYFVLKANNRGPEDADMVMLSRISECIQRANGTRISFRVIINQIQGEDVYGMYKEEVANDNFRNVFKTLKLEGFSFDNIQIDNVLLLRYDENAVKCKDLRDTISKEVKEQRKARVALVKDISTCIVNDDLELYKKALLVLGSPAILFGGAVVGTSWGLYKASRLTLQSIGSLFEKK
ncbi:hypothetical protein BGZ65_001963 [Modicella reniformis]|uniref:G domain-containing protein n=1 Tax=Modicella reniformis TaxID=1440133 RepID=A0A9P6MJA1_9FUNG|nr:hypothetical protein BGZ65_001963 [Modicella reniformis]